jgi:TIR domain
MRVERLYFDLRDRGLDPWYDKEKLIVGDHWEDEIIEAIRQSDFFAIFLSQVSARKRGFIQREIRIAIREYQRLPYGTVYLSSEIRGVRGSQYTP